MSELPPSKPMLTLVVREALQQDVAYGRIRIDGAARIEANLSPGDVVLIKNAENPLKFTGAVVWRSHPGDEGLGVAHIDNLARKTLGLAVGDKITVQKANVFPATKLTLKPAINEEQKLEFGDGIEALAKRGLLKRPVVAGDLITVPNIALFGNALPFIVTAVETHPGPVDSQGVYLVNEGTKVEIEGAKGTLQAVTTIESKDGSGAYPALDIKTPAQAAGLAVDIQAYAIDAAATCLAHGDKDGEERMAEAAVLATRILHLLGYKLGSRN